MLAKSKRVLITGAGGMLGSAFAAELMAKGYEIRAKSHAMLDVTDSLAVQKEQDFQPDWIIHTAGIVNADYCEQYKEECINSHVEGTKNIIALAKASRARLFYPQSFLIFDGKTEPITEETMPHPLSAYGEAKWVAEKAILGTLKDSLVVRMGGFFGGCEKDKNFIGMFTRLLKKKIEEGVVSMPASDRVWQPTYTLDLARNSILLLEQSQSGIYNMASHGAASFFDIASVMVETFSLQNRITLEKVSADYFQEKAKRPSQAVMVNKRLQKEGCDQMRPWKEALLEYLALDYFQMLYHI